MTNTTTATAGRLQSPNNTEVAMPPEQNSERIAFRATPSLKKACERAAERDGLSLSDWFRFCLARAAVEGVFRPPGKRRGKA